jgi:uncharacterized flavoprotein (TIGR03862 family)
VFVPNATWHGFGPQNDHALRIRHGSEFFDLTVSPDVAVLALGGASWPRLGSDGSWVGALERVGVSVTPLQAANCGLCVAWTDHVKAFRGEPLKNVALTCGSSSVRGEIMLDSSGIEGGAVYAIGREARRLLREGNCAVTVDLRADISLDALIKRLATRHRGSQSVSTWLAKSAGLTPPAIAVLREANRTLPLDPSQLAAAIKSVPLHVSATYSIDRAISTAGGVSLTEVNDDFSLKSKQNTFVIGEMLDWEAPTGGYLLQACFSTAAVASHAILNRA